MSKIVSPAAAHALREALSVVYHYKADLRAFLASCLGDHRDLVSQLDWTAYKRNVVTTLVSSLERQQPRFTDTLLNLMLATAELDVQHLKRLDDGGKQYNLALGALKVLREQVEPYRAARNAAEDATRRKEEERARAEQRRAVTEKVEELKQQFLALFAKPPQERGYALERLLNDLFAVFDIDAKAPFRLVGEQIDGAFTYEGEYLLEAKWHQELTPVADLDIFSSKVKRKLDNTLGLFVSMTGFQPTAVDVHSNRAVIILMDGADLMAVLEGRIELPELLKRKRQHAARTGEIYLRAYDILGQ